MKRFIVYSFLASVVGCAPNVVEDGGGSSSGAGGAALVGSSNCPSSGGTMEAVPQVDGGSYCIDQTEVTNKAYAAWLATNPSQDLRPVDAVGNGDPAGDCKHVAGGAHALTYTPERQDESGATVAAWPVDPSLEDHPVVYVTWCDAFVYCADHGKRLCGKVGGGIFSSALDLQDPRLSEYQSAVTRGGGQTFPYGDTYERDACGANLTVGDADSAAPSRPVASLPSCEGGFDGIYDLLGNVGEFVQWCRTDPFGDPSCSVNGARVAAGIVTPAVAVDEQDLLPSASTDPSVGFRCCAEVLPSP